MMSRVMRGTACAWLSLWLAACTPMVKPSPPQMEPDAPYGESRTDSNHAAAASSAATLHPVTVVADMPAPAPRADLWQELRDSFVLDDCGGDNLGAVDHWARLFTESPGHFEANLQQALPSLRYIQQIARQRGMPGEFVLLPWVESHYLPVFARRDRPVGMWQIMPQTARSIGLKVNHDYDARLDTAATTEAIFDLIARYQEQYHDWRLADYAFNGGAGTVNRLLDRYGAPPASPVIPKLPVRRATREHLIKLMAIACVIRQPEHYGVRLPLLASSERLEPVVIPKAMPVAEAAAKAGLPEARLTQLNSAFLDGTIDPHRSETLLLPRANVQHWYDTQATAQSTPPQTSSVQTATENSIPPPAAASRHHRRYTVKPGDTVSGIAQRHHLSASKLMRLNHLGHKPLQPGQVLDLGPRKP